MIEIYMIEAVYIWLLQLNIAI